jgi:hypothetical protein
LNPKDSSKMGPYRTRNTIVIDFPTGVKVSSINNPATNHVSTCYHISSGRVFTSNPIHTMCISLWDKKGNAIIAKLEVKMPFGWTPKLYFGALLCCIKRDEEVKIRHVYSSWGGISSFLTLNEVHWLYNNTSINEIEQAIINGGGARILL